MFFFVRSFKTDERESILAYAPGKHGSSDYALGTIECGQPVFYYNTGAGRLRLPVHHFVSDGHYHELRVVQEGCYAKVYLDGDSSQTELPSNIIPSEECGLQLNRTLLIGGGGAHPLPAEFRAMPVFRGCMHSLFIDNGDAGLAILIDSSQPGVSVGCASGSCSPGICGSGQCVASDIIGPTCDCFEAGGFTGLDCSEGKGLQKAK